MTAITTVTAPMRTNFLLLRWSEIGRSVGLAMELFYFGKRLSIAPEATQRYARNVRKTSLVIDDELMAQEKEALGTTGLKETIDTALREAVKARARRNHIERLRTMR